MSGIGNVAVLGCGGWGTALAIHLGRVGATVRLWGRDAGLVADLAARRENSTYLPGIALPERVHPTAALETALTGAACVVLAVPSHGMRDVLGRVASGLSSDAVVVSATKGLEVGSHLRMSEVIVQELGADRPVVVVSGPSFAEELARALPTAIAVAGRRADAVEMIQQGFRSPSFRLYATEDVTGVEIGGAMKNVIAIAAGVVESLGLGHNAQAALITRGLAEMSRLAAAVGGRRDTLAGLSGLGDLVLTCTGRLSRNRQLGIELGKGERLDDVLSRMKTVAEGVRTTGAALSLGRAQGIELPITGQVDAVLAGRTAPRAAVEALMLRRQRSEVESR